MKKALKFILPPIIVVFGVLILVIFVKTKPKAAKASTETKAPLVSVATASASEESAQVRGQGTVIAARELVVVPEVQGRVIALNEGLVAGGYLKKGESLLKINPKDYRLRVQQQAAQVEGARFNLEVERSRRKIAEREWKLIGDSIPSDESGKALALRQPHQRNARAGLAAANSGLALARLNLSRTSIDVPFNALVLQESVDIGQVVGPASRVATLVGTDQFWVRVNVPVEQLGFIKLPSGDAEGSAATVVQQAGEASASREGRVIRLLGDVDPVGRMARVLVQVEDPLGLEGDKPGLPLLIGAFVRVDIKGRDVKDAVSIPRVALRENDRVWVLNKDDTLEIRDVEVAWRQRDTLLLSKGVSAGERVVTSRLEAPVGGMPLRTAASPEDVQ